MFAAWSAGAIAVVCVLIFTPAVIALSRRWKLYDPLGPLKIHDGAISRLGGVSISIGLAAAILFESVSTSKYVSIWWFAAFGLIWLTGLIDDVRDLSPFLKLAAQGGAGMLLWAGGWRLPGHFSAPLEILAVCAIVVVFVNAFNFLDGSDGLAAGVTAIIGTAFGTALGNVSSFGALVAWGLVGATLGFLFFNFPPARIFMGDSGSTVLGFCVAFLSLDFLGHSQTQHPAVRWIFLLLIAGLPVIDGIVVVLRRLIRGDSPLHGDRSHFYDRMMKNGWSSRAVAVISYAISALLGAAGLWLIGREIPAVVIFAVVPVIGLFVAGLKRAHADGSLRRAIREQAES
jgi:UDP-GlcNAc:undecaprenyl-phosphate/decaprenyl-phosphate GlcNAc-1-phosphate transferase